MTPRGRVLWFGSAFLLIALGAIASPAIGGVTGEAIMIALVSLGGILFVALVFYEVGLSEDRDRAAAARRLARRAPRPPLRHRPRRPRRPT